VTLFSSAKGGYVLRLRILRESLERDVSSKENFRPGLLKLNSEKLFQGGGREEGALIRLCPLGFQREKGLRAGKRGEGIERRESLLSE